MNEGVLYLKAYTCPDDHRPIGMGLVQLYRDSPGATTTSASIWEAKVQNPGIVAVALGVPGPNLKITKKLAAPLQPTEQLGASYDQFDDSGGGYVLFDMADFSEGAAAWGGKVWQSEAQLLQQNPKKFGCY